jgi:hypothetical protein
MLVHCDAAADHLVRDFVLSVAVLHLTT